MARRKRPVTSRYDRIGIDYAELRKPDPRIAATIEAALGEAKSVLNVGAGGRVAGLRRSRHQPGSAPKWSQKE